MGFVEHRLLITWIRWLLWCGRHGRSHCANSYGRTKSRFIAGPKRLGQLGRNPGDQRTKNMGKRWKQGPLVVLEHKGMIEIAFDGNLKVLLGLYFFKGLFSVISMSTFLFLFLFSFNALAWPRGSRIYRKILPEEKSQAKCISEDLEEPGRANKHPSNFWRNFSKGYTNPSFPVGW